MRRGTFQWMKSVNKSIVLNKIRVDAPISRAQIAKDTELTPPTVSSIVKDFLEQGLIKESESGHSSGGRKPTMLRINQQAFYVIGIDAGPETVNCIVSDLGGNIEKRLSVSIHLPTTEDAFMDMLKQCITDIIKSAALDPELTLGIGVAMHGVVDVETGTSLYAPNLNLRDIPIKESLENTFDMDVIVENDARAMALGEAWFGEHGVPESMLAVNIGRGVGAGFIIDGELYHGDQDIAGEVGHMTIDMNGEICACGNKGCLQTFATGDAIGRRAAGKIGHGDRNVRPLTGEMVYERAASGDTSHIKVLEETGDVIGIALTNLIHIMNPGKIVLGGGVMKAADILLPHIRQSVGSRALTKEAKQTQITVTELGDEATLLGAVSLFLVEIFALR